MAATSSKAVLITGANVGLGKEVARQLALAGDFDRIYLACRNTDSGRSAAAELERITGRSIFTVIPMDLTDLDSVKVSAEHVGWRTAFGSHERRRHRRPEHRWRSPLIASRRSSVPTYWATLYCLRISSTPGP